MKVAFLYLNNETKDALVNWVHTVARFVTDNEVVILPRLHSVDVVKPDVVVAIANGAYKTAWIDEDLADLRRRGIPFGVLHAEDWGVPTPGDYPSACWTTTAARHLGVTYNPVIIPQPIFPQIMETSTIDGIHVATFGMCEQKKHTLAMAHWAKRNDFKFTAYTPNTYAHLYADYWDAVRRAGGNVVAHPWMDRIEDLGPLFNEGRVSHFLFVNDACMGGCGGCPTSPRYAPMFGRPVMAIDGREEREEVTFPGFSQAYRLDDFHARNLPTMNYATNTRSPSAYVRQLYQMIEGH